LVCAEYSKLLTRYVDFTCPEECREKFASTRFVEEDDDSDDENDDFAGGVHKISAAIGPIGCVQPTDVCSVYIKAVKRSKKKGLIYLLRVRCCITISISINVMCFYSGLSFPTPTKNGSPRRTSLLRIFSNASGIIWI
jgi:hypothetical protein